MRNRKGFTLIEMLVVIAVIGILSAAVLAALGPARSKAKDARIISALNQVRAIAEANYDGDYSTLPADGTVPTTGNVLASLAVDIGANQGVLILSRATDDLTYAAHSVLPSGAIYCVDSAGFAGKTTAPAVNAGVCP